MMCRARRTGADFMIVPQEIEFWADGEHRLHDRFRFTPDGKGGWDIQRLNP